MEKIAFKFEAEVDPVDHIDTTIAILTGQTVQVSLQLNNTIRQEKENILFQNHVADPDLYVMILCGQDSSRKILSDEATVRFYKDQLMENNAQIEINLQSYANEQQASAADSQKYNFKLKR
ncbi:hypothetical protein Bpfe_003644 [Biomphalaria pfeifferi]|uniref:Uncharacterized protein n=1 Tax=Biomphalaria pfeifferi TaxID=112525 RepID=A0AAD8C7C7_BIOPF|nr:hypothetical protein Bpfe_003644 [Biomphalaria pfeifferi]